MQEIIQLHSDLQKLIRSAITFPILESDPYKMTESEFLDFYDRLIKEYTMLTKQDSPLIEEPLKEEKREARRLNRVGISSTPLSNRILNIEKDSYRYLTIPKKERQLQSPVSAAFGEGNAQDVEDIEKLLQQLS